jgi:hypothetical protein
MLQRKQIDFSLCLYILVRCCRMQAEVNTHGDLVGFLVESEVRDAPEMQWTGGHKVQHGATVWQCFVIKSSEGSGG